MKKTLLSLRALALAAAALGLGACATGVGTGGDYNVVAHRPNNPDNVRIKVSLANQAVYVMEGDRPLLVAATCVGTPAKPTPKGNFRVTEKIPKKRSGSYGFWVNGNSIAAGTSGQSKGGRYVGYPMANWVGFYPAYGFHEGYVWPVPRTHGCLRLHKNVSAKFFALAKMGTSINVSQTQPEDATIGRNLRRPTDYNDPDPPGAFLTSDRVYQAPSAPLFN